jgi:hypothetical protein
MRILPHIYNSALNESELKKAECSDRLYVSQHTFSNYMEDSDEGTTVCLVLKNGVDQVLTGCLFGVHDDDNDLVYVPSWMYHELDMDDTHVSLERAALGLCTGLMVQPHSSEHTCVENPLELLQHAFEYYTTLTSGATIPLYLPDDKSMMVTVLEVRPMSQEPRCLRNGEIELELMRPLDMPLPVPPAPASPAAPVPAQGHALGGSATATGQSRRELALQAALKRLKMSEESNTK